MQQETKHTSTWVLLAISAAALLAVTMGSRLSLGLFVSPLNTATGLGIASISFAMAINQFVWGAIQPVAGALADRYGAGRVLAIALIVQTIGLTLTPLMQTSLSLDLALGILCAAGSGAAAFSVLIGAIAQRLPLNRRGMSAGIVNAGGSLGQFIFAPLVQGVILAAGWVTAFWTLAAFSLCALPLARILRKPVGVVSSHRAPHSASPIPLRTALRTALQDRSYLLLHAGFFTCGFHIAFLVTHLPGEVDLCGLPSGVASWSLSIIGFFNILGSLAAGWFVQRYRSKMVLAAMYGSRALLVLLFLAAPRYSWVFYVFAAGLGFTWLATVPPTANVVSKLFGDRHLSTLFGLTLFSHQVGGFLGAWLGGLAMERWQSLNSMWWADAVLAGLAALANLPIKEQKMGTLEPIIAT